MTAPFRVSWLVVLVLVAFASPSEAQRKPWEHAPGPIAGTWRVSCQDSAGMQVKFTLSDSKNAVGVVTRLGAAKQVGYRVGEQIFKVAAQDSGAWVGKHLWRSINGVKRWDPIYFVASAERLHAQMSTDGCYRNMTRVR